MQAAGHYLFNFQQNTITTKNEIKVNCICLSVCAVHEFTSYYQFYYNIIKFKFNFNEMLRWPSAKRLLCDGVCALCAVQVILSVFVHETV